MASVTVIARPGKIATDSVTITMHATVSETHTLANAITDHPVETGFNVSDHSRPEPEVVQMDCRISNTPLTPQQQTQAVKAGEFTVQSSSNANAGAIGATDGYAFQQWRKLRDLRDAGTLVTVSTTLGDYTSMGIQSITAPRNNKNYDGIAFSITFKRVRVVQNKLTRSVVAKDPRAQKKKSAGNKTPKEEEVNHDSALFKSADSASQSNNATLKGVGAFLLRQ
jgi:hypothetical protein